MRGFCAISFVGLLVGMVLSNPSANAYTNLLTNGDFETGTPAGWTTWRAPWGQQEQYVWNDTTVGRSGNYDLKITALGSSFGVYQTVSVTPGHYYRLDAKWKATVTASSNWFELEVLQGGYDYNQTDIRPYDLPNKMYSYDSPENPPITFDWTLTPTLDGGPADSPGITTNHYHGVRQATGNQMTIVLKAGGNPNMNGGQSVVSWFDNVAFYEVPEPATALLLGLGSLVLARKRRSARV